VANSATLADDRFSKEYRDLEDRVLRLEHLRDDAGVTEVPPAGGPATFPIAFTMDGPLYIADSLPFSWPVETEIRHFELWLRTPGTTATTVQFVAGGEPQDEMLLNPGVAKSQYAGLAWELQAFTDGLLRVVLVGSGAAGLSVIGKAVEVAG
jgi:hypothetical protein